MWRATMQEPSKTNSQLLSWPRLVHAVLHLPEQRLHFREQVHAADLQDAIAQLQHERRALQHVEDVLDAAAGEQRRPCVSLMPLHIGFTTPASSTMHPAGVLACPHGAQAAVVLPLASHQAAGHAQTNQKLRQKHKTPNNVVQKRVSVHVCGAPRRTCCTPGGRRGG